MRKLTTIIAVSGLILSGCSTVMEAERPSATNLQSFSVGIPRLQVISRLGAPVSTVKNGDDSCDIYRLYTKGTSTAGKGAIILGEAAADVFTIGLFEAVATPAEAMSKAHPHTVLFCYSASNALVSVTDQGRTVEGGGQVAANPAAPSPAPERVASQPTATQPPPPSRAAAHPQPALTCRRPAVTSPTDPSAVQQIC